MAKRLIEAFGSDAAEESSAAVTKGIKKTFGKQKDATPSKNDEASRRQHRAVRAWGYLPRCVEGPLQKDHARGDKASRQNAATGEFMPEGGNSAGTSMKGVDPYFAADCQGRSGQPDNQSINRPKGST